MNARDMNAKIPVIFRTYESPPKEPSIPCKVWDSGRLLAQRQLRLRSSRKLR